ncbi:MAG: ATP-binding protein [Chloroflexi bacterium]|nr:ATP-binding protein [Chloroflexota bacterium]
MISNYVPKSERVYADWVDAVLDNPKVAAVAGYSRAIQFIEGTSKPQAATLEKAVKLFALARHLPFGFEVANSFASIRDCLSCDALEKIGAASNSMIWLDSLPEPLLRPEVMYSLSQLRSVATEVQLVNGVTAKGRKSLALSRANDTLRELGNYVEAECFDPEKTLLTRVIEKWMEIITQAGGEVGRSVLEINKIPNNYIVGPALRNQQGRLFVGRDDIYNEAMRLWSNEQVKQPILFYGQRRMGKTSILLHLESGLGEEYLPVFLDLQGLASVKSVGAFLYNLADSTAEQLNKLLPGNPSGRKGREDPKGLGVTKGLEAIPIPSLADYGGEPFIAFRKFLDTVEAAVPPGKWAVLMLDEFERAEEKLQEGIFPPDLMLSLRTVMQHRPRIVLVLAGSHRLDEMRHDYWNPLLGIAHPIKVGYLNYDASYELITNPWEDFPLNYDRQAVEKIIEVTCGQPLLLQAICSGVVERVNLRLARGGAQTLPTATMDDAEIEIQNTLEKNEYFRAVFESLSPKQTPVPQAQTLLKALAMLQRQARVERTRVESSLKNQYDVAALVRGWETLERRDVIEVEGSEVKVTVELMRRWLRK